MRLRLVLVTATLVLLAVAIGGLFLWRGDVREPHAQVVTDSSASEGWKTIEYQGVRVDIPSNWKRSDLGTCESQFEHWAPQDEIACGAKGAGVSFYASATFDPRHRPGLRRGDVEVDGAAWAGYTYAGEYAVYVTGDDRGLVQEVLTSARIVDEANY